MNSPQRVLSGIQPTSSDLHLGNYLGSLKTWIKLQTEAECLFCIVNLHALTGNLTAAELKENTQSILTTYLAAGINPKKATVFLQSSVAAHSQLAWIFNTITPVAELERMTQYKDKQQQQTKNINVGLLTYPALMAADILLYQATQIPVGEDQIQHLELTNLIVRKFNNRYQKDFFKPVTKVLSKAPRIMSLADPTQKMSKSLGPKHYLSLLDSQEKLYKKIKSAVTASESGQTNTPGIKNLLQIIESLDPETSPKVTARLKSKELSYAELKEIVFKVVWAELEPIQTRYQQIKKDSTYLADVLIQGNQKAQKLADQTLSQVNQLIGLN